MKQPSFTFSLYDTLVTTFSLGHQLDESEKKMKSPISLNQCLEANKGYKETSCVLNCRL